MHKNRDLPTDMPEVSVEIAVNDEGLVYLPAVLQAAGLVPSAGQARRDIDGGGVKLDGEAVAPKKMCIRDRACTTCPRRLAAERGERVLVELDRKSSLARVRVHVDESGRTRLYR